MRELLSAPLSSRKIVEYLLLFLLLASVLSAAAYGGYWYGKKQVVTPPQTVTPKAKELPSQKAVDETAGWKVFKNEEAGTRYVLKYLAGWQLSRVHELMSNGKDVFQDVTTLAKNNFKIKISQLMGVDSGACLYPGDPEYKGPSRRYGSFEEFTIAGNIVRRAKPLDEKGQSGWELYQLCQKDASGFSGYTSFGFIAYEVPLSASEGELSELDSIVQTLELIH